MSLVIKETLSGRAFILGPERGVSQGRSGGMKGLGQCSEGRTRGETLRQACGPEGLSLVMSKAVEGEGPGSRGPWRSPQECQVYPRKPGTGQ